MKKRRSIIPIFIILIAGLAVLAYFQVPRHIKYEDDRTVTEDVINFLVEYEVRSNQDTTLWSSGEIMEQGMPLYFFSLEPDLTIYPTLEAINSHTGSVDVEVRLENVDGDGNTYWSKVIKDQQYDISIPDEENLPPIELNLMEINELSETISEELGLQRGGRGNLQVGISLNADLEAESISHKFAFIMDSHGLIPPPEDELVAQKEIVSDDSEKIMQERTLSDYLECTYFRTYGSLIIVLIIFAFVTYSREKKDEYSRYDCWVSRAIVPKVKEPKAYFATLKELIDTAIELDKKVIYDVKREAYFVIDGDNWYVHKKRNE
ncbi:MAG: DUF5305 family protein [Bacillota bacterium]